MNSKVFPVKNNQTIVPDRFYCTPLDVTLPEFRELSTSGCVSITPVESAAGWEIARRGNSEPDHIDMYVVISGAIALETAEESLVARAGDIIMIVSWIDRYIKTVEPGRHIYMCFNNPEAYPCIRSNKVYLNHKLAETVDYYVRAMLDRNVALPEEYRYMVSLASLLNILIMRELRKGSGSEFGEAENLQKILNDPGRRNFEVRHIARKMGMSLSKFRIFCLTYFNKTPRAVVDEARMMRARAMLDFSMLSIDEIAVELGFADRFAFSKSFSRLHKISPVAFRKRYARKKL